MKKEAVIIAMVLTLLITAGCKSSSPEKNSMNADNITDFPEYASTWNEEINIKEEKFYSDFQTISLGKVVLVVDSNTYDSLKEEIERFADDISTDMNTNVKILSDSFSSPEDVRDALLSEKVSNGDFDGAIFIGDTPWQYAMTKGSVLGSGPSDAWYLDLEGRNQYYQRKTTCEGNDSACKASYVEIDADEGLKHVPRWSGRILPPVGRPNRLELLKNYFDRNHNYRLGGIEYEGALLYAPDFSLSQYSCTGYNDCFLKAIGRLVVTGITSEDKLTLIMGEPGSNNTKSTYLVKQQEPNKFEWINAHGSGNNFWTGNDDEYITYDDIAKNEPGALFSSFISCSVGDFSVTDNLASAYVFEGQGLAAYGATIPIFGGSLFDSNVDSSTLILGYGGRLYEAFDSETRHYFHIIGDPTLRINKLQGGCRLAFNTTLIDFGKVNLKKENGIIQNFDDLTTVIKIRDEGSEDCRLQLSLKSDDFSGIGYNFSEQKNLLYTIKQGETEEISLSVSPKESSKGLLTGSLRFIANDQQYIKYLPFTMILE